jgi:hypothetical protein
MRLNAKLSACSYSPFAFTPKLATVMDEFLAGHSGHGVAEQHRDELDANWERAMHHEKPQPIDPLR